MNEPTETEINTLTGEGCSPAPCSSLGDELPKEIERCQELLVAYSEIGPVGNFGAAMIKQDIRNALNAMASGDAVEMLRSYEALKGCK